LRSALLSALFAWGSSLAAAVRRTNPWLLLIIPAFYLVTLHLVDGRYPISHSYAANVLWSYEWAEQFRHGILYPRWMEHTFVGLGSPTFHFYGPFCMYAVLPFSVGLGLSMSTSVLLSFWAALLVMALGMARLTGTLFGPRHRWLPALLAVVTLLSPYALLDVYVRGALAEIWAMALLPWLLAALLHIIDSPGRAARFALIAAAAAFALCHPALLLLGSVCIGLSALITSRGWSELVRWIRRGLVPLLAGFSLDAFYLVSAIGDQKHVQIQELTKHDNGLAFNRLLVQELGRLSLKTPDGFDGSMVPAFLFCCLATVAALGLLRRCGRLDGEVRGRRISVLLTIAAISAMMMTDLSRGIYAVFPLLNTIQFAWRGMAVLTVATLPLWGYVLLLTVRSKRRRDLPWRIPVCLITLWISTQAFATTMAYTNWDKAASEKTDALLARMRRAGRESDAGAGPIRDFMGLIHINAADEAILEDVREYRPLTQTNEGLPPRTFSPVEWMTGKGAIMTIEWDAGRRQFAIDSPTGGQLLVRTTAWLGWAITVNGKRTVGDQAGDWGRMIVTVPPGHSHVTIAYRGTPSQRVGTLLSLVVLLLLIAYAIGWRPRKILTAVSRCWLRTERRSGRDGVESFPP